jgi:2-polyprenyl-6-methoxyphenol hydroxylase-like FAD-dependent oxidoreductase
MFAAFPLNLAALPDNPLYLLMVPQRRIVQMLMERADELGIEVRRGHEVTGLAQDRDTVTVEVSGPAGPYRVETRFLVGADGGRSAVRKAAGIDFPGVTTDRTISRSGHVHVPPELIDPATGGLAVPGYGTVPPFMHHRTERGLIAYAPFPSGPPLLTTGEQRPPGDDGSDYDQPPTLAELRDSARRVLGVEVAFDPPNGAGPHMMRRLIGGNTRLADRFREGRVLLVGDAAHVHSAIGGPGLNLGLQDVVNLGWKLAAQVQGWAPPHLLDTYDIERRPAAEQVVMHTQAQSVLVGPGREVTALRELFSGLLSDGQTVQHLADLIAGADIRYDMTPSANGAPVPPLTGRWAPDLLLHTQAGTTRLAELTRVARPLLLDLTDGGMLADEAAPWRDRVDAVTARADRLADGSKPSALLLRPDCYVAWVSESTHPDDRQRQALRDALTHWFGSPLAEGTG